MKSWNLGPLAVALVLLLAFKTAEAFDPLDPIGNITIKWDVIQWTPDGYTAVVTMYNWQLYRHIEAPGWTLGWHWGKKEVIWNMVGGQTTFQGDCSKWKIGPPPHCCAPNPNVIDLLPGVPYSQQVANCCRGGVLSSFSQDPKSAVASFQVTVGNSGNTNTTVVLPKNITLLSPGTGYTCGPATKVAKTLFPSPDGRRFTQALMTWNVICLYSQHLAQKAQTCCVSFSSFYNSTIVPCAECACACQSNSTALTTTSSQSCIDPNSPLHYIPAKSNGLTKTPDMLYCTRDMCPVKVHWHVKTNYQEYWRVKITITNRDLSRNYSQWNLVIQHPNFINFTEAFSFSYKSLNPYGSHSNDSAIFYGVKYYNEMLMQAGPDGNVQSEILFRKDPSFQWAHGWAFPHRVYFNGDDCVLPELQDYPSLPNSSPTLSMATPLLLSVGAAVLASALNLF